MIQRQQSLWLLLSAVCAFFSFRFPFYFGNRINASNMQEAAELDGASNFFLLILTGAILLIAVVTIFLFKDRKFQLRMALLGVLLSAGLLALYIVEVRKFVSGSISLWCLFSVAILIGFIMAARGIRNDQKLVKSLDKLR